MTLSLRLRPLASLVGLALCAAGAVAQPTVLDCRWTLGQTIGFDNPRTAVYNPLDGLVYAVRRSSGSDGLYVINPDNSATRIVGADRPAALMVDPADGDLFFSEDYGGSIYRVGLGATERETWVSGFHSGDDDPVGMTIVPPTYTGGVVAPGTTLSVDRGNGGADEVWAWSTAAAEDEVRLHTDDGTLVDGVDIAANDTHIIVVDDRGSNGALLEIADNAGTLSAVATSVPLDSPIGAVFDPVSGNLFVATPTELLQVNFTDNPGEVHTVATGFTLLGWACLSVRADGQSVLIADYGGDAIYELVFGGFCSADFNEDCAVNTQDVLAFLNAWTAGSETADFNEDGTVNTLDVLVFLNAWTAGC